MGGVFLGKGRAVLCGSNGQMSWCFKAEEPEEGEATGHLKKLNRVLTASFAEIRKPCDRYIYIYIWFYRCSALKRPKHII